MFQFALLWVFSAIGQFMLLILLWFVFAFSVLGIFGIAWFNRWMDRQGKAKKYQADQDAT